MTTLISRHAAAGRAPAENRRVADLHAQHFGGGGGGSSSGGTVRRVAPGGGGGAPKRLRAAPPPPRPPPTDATTLPPLSPRSSAAYASIDAEFEAALASLGGVALGCGPRGHARPPAAPRGEDAISWASGLDERGEDDDTDSVAWEEEEEEEESE